jgi:hypothetical protein
MFFVPKKEHCSEYSEKLQSEGRCRRNAPTMKGYPVVYGISDWCGEHKIGSNPVRDGKENPTTEEMANSLWNKPVPMLCVQHGGSPACERINAANKLTCPKCGKPPIIEESEAFDLPLTVDSIRIQNDTDAIVTFDRNSKIIIIEEQNPAEKKNIKEEIGNLIFCIQEAGCKHTKIGNLFLEKTKMIAELLEKL